MDNRDSGHRPEHIGSVLKGLLGQPEWEGPSTAHRALLLWDRVVGEELARHSEAMALQMDQGTLIVEVEHSVWMHHLQMQEETLRERINHQLGRAMVRQIRFRLATSRSEESAPPLPRGNDPSKGSASR